MGYIVKRSVPGHFAGYYMGFPDGFGQYAFKISYRPARKSLNPQILPILK